MGAGSRLRAACVGLLAGLAACAAPVPAPAPPVSTEASIAFVAARVSERAGDPEAAREHATRAAELEPDWIAPQRLLSDLARNELTGPVALDAWRARAQEAPGSAMGHYLAGRLEGAAGRDRFRQAVRSDPRCAWAWHGLAWRDHLDGRPAAAQRAGERALSLARDAFERTYFTHALARYLEAGDASRQAVVLLATRLQDAEVAAPDRVWLAAQLAQLEARSRDEDIRRRGRVRALDLIANARLTDSELRGLVGLGALRADARRGALAARAQSGLLSEGGASGTHAALEARQLLADGGLSPLALALAARATEAGTFQGPRDGDARFALELSVRTPADIGASWLADLPRQVLDEDGRPEDARLAAVARAALDGEGDLGAALLGAGWFEAARAWAATVPGGDLDAALQLDRRAAAGQQFLREVRRVIAYVDQGRGRFEPDLEATVSDPFDGGEDIDDLRDLLRSVGQLAAEAQRVLQRPGLVADLPNDLAASPLIHYGIAGVVVHPGPRWSALDERLGAGVEGEPVPGLAAATAELGRFALFGDAWGTPPDGALLRRVHVEERSGEHLGLPWSGTVVLCDGVDLDGRDGRRGARIAGAALHEGYWLELGALRSEVDEWDALRTRFEGPDGPARVAAALGVRGLAASDRAQRRSIDHLLGEGNRLRLAVLLERGPGDGTLGRITLDELVAVTAVHEEAHLCDRGRWFPIGEHWLEVLGLLWDAGFSPVRLMRRLEYRAQLVALCASPDPRLALVEMLDAAENGTDITPHAAGYRRLLGDLVDRLDEELQDGTLPAGTLVPGRTLVHQLHALDPEVLRSVGLRVAAAEGLVAPKP